MDGYYDYHPLLSLDRHVALAGYLGAETRVIGYRLAAVTGLPVVDIDRSIEHDAGKSIWHLIWTETEAQYRNLERRELERALSARPFSILTLGDGALLDPVNRKRLLEQTHLVALDLDLANTYWRLQAGDTADKDFWHPLHSGPLERVEQVKPYFDIRQTALDVAHHRIDLRGKTKSAAVSALQDLLESLTVAA
ncbi:MAG: shikimate kinase [Acidobacteriota bacterium]